LLIDVLQGGFLVVNGIRAFVNVEVFFVWFIVHYPVNVFLIFYPAWNKPLYSFAHWNKMGLYRI